MVFESPVTPTEIPGTDLLSWIFDECRYDINRPIILDAQQPEKSLSWAQTKSFVRKATAGFKKFGVADGDCVFFHARNHMYYYPLVYGCIGAGGIHCASRPTWKQHEMANFARTIDAKWFVVETEFLEIAIDLVEGLSLPKSNIVVLDRSEEADEIKTDHGTFKTTTYLLQQGETDWTRLKDVASAKQKIGIRSFTSGTTGLPKAVEISHYALVAQINPWNSFLDLFDHEVRMLQYMNLGGISGHGIITTGLKLGLTICVTKLITIANLVETCQKLQAEVIMLDPSTALRITKELPDDSQALRSLRDIKCVSWSLPAEAQQKLRQLLHPDCMLTRPYGITEIGTVAAVTDAQRHLNDPCSVGFTWPGISIRLIDDAGNEIDKYDESGELSIKGPTLFAGYYKNPTSTQEAFDEEGWFRTGDLGYISSKTKQWYLIGRKKDMFKVLANQVSPEEIEALLVSHPNIMDAAVTPVLEDGEVDPKIRAYVVPRKHGGIGESEVVDLVARKLATHKAITGGVKFVDALPRNQAGKLVRAILGSIAVQ